MSENKLVVCSMQTQADPNKHYPLPEQQVCVNELAGKALQSQAEPNKHYH